MKAIIFLTQTCLSIILGIFLVRLFLQAVRGNFRNPITQFITRFTNQIILPLRKLLPPLWKVDTASLVSVVLVSFCMNAILVFLGSIPLVFFVQQPYGFLLATFLRIFLATLNLYWLLILFSIIISWVQPNQHSPLTALLHELTEPILAPTRRLIKPVGGLDLSPIPVLLVISALQYQFSGLI